MIQQVEQEDASVGQSGMFPKTSDCSSLDPEAAASPCQLRKCSRVLKRTQSTQDTEISQESDPLDDASSSAWSKNETSWDCDQIQEQRLNTVTSHFSRIVSPSRNYDCSNFTDRRPQTWNLGFQQTQDDSECDNLLDDVRKPSSFVSMKRDHRRREEITLPQPQRRNPPSPPDPVPCHAPSPRIFAPSVGGAFTRYQPIGQEKSWSPTGNARALTVKWMTLIEENECIPAKSGKETKAPDEEKFSDLSSADTGGSIVNSLPNLSGIAAASTAWNHHLSYCAKNPSSVRTVTETSGSFAEDDISCVSSKAPSSLTGFLSVEHSGKEWCCPFRCHVDRRLCRHFFTSLGWICHPSVRVDKILIISLALFLAVLVLTIIMFCLSRG